MINLTLGQVLFAVNLSNVSYINCNTNPMLDSNNMHYV